VVVEIEPIENWIMDIDPVVVIVPSETSQQDEDVVENDSEEDS